MKRLPRYFLCIPFLLVLLSAHGQKGDQLTGAWLHKNGSEERVLLFKDGYVTYTTFNKEGKQFVQTSGGPYKTNGKDLQISYEFHTGERDKIGQMHTYTIVPGSNGFTTTLSGDEKLFQRVDNGQTGLAGAWKITARKGENGLMPIHGTGTRKTLKILTGSRFQWAAIDPGTKQFMGTGGGSYSFKDGKYTENIEFFSRDSSRVGSSLSFEGKLQDGNWHHSGHSSKGDPIYEVWSREN